MGFALLSVLFLCIAYLPRPGYGIAEGTVVSVGKRTQVSPRKGLPGETGTKVSCTYSLDGKEYTAEYSTREFPQKGDKLKISYKKDAQGKTINPYQKTDYKRMSMSFLLLAALAFYMGIRAEHLQEKKLTQSPVKRQLAKGEKY